jgi:NADPH:quinone reductase-like Zn-dependent oxidoreductase
MKAIWQNVYGSPDVLQVLDIPQPVAGDGEVLIQVRAASLHIGDWHVMTGLPYMLRVIGFGLRVPNAHVRGVDVAGTVSAVGNNVTEFKVGDDVFGTCAGAFAEYACAAEGNVAHKPANLDYADAAAMPTSSFAALQALRDRGEIKAGQRVLIVGAAGGVGMFAIQIAKSFGAEVTGVCSTSKTEVVRSLGADHVIDYTKEDFTRSAEPYDIILDVGGSRTLSDLRAVLKPSGVLVLIGGEGGGRVLGGTGKWIHALALSPFVSQRLRPLSTVPNKRDLLAVKALIEAGNLKPVIDRAFTLSEVPNAFRYLATRRGQGKIVVTM